MTNLTYGYIRVSSKDQNEARQLDALTEVLVPRENIFIDKKTWTIMDPTFASSKYDNDGQYVQTLYY